MDKGKIETTQNRQVACKAPRAQSQTSSSTLHIIAYINNLNARVSPCVQVTHIPDISVSALSFCKVLLRARLKYATEEQSIIYLSSTSLLGMSLTHLTANPARHGTYMPKNKREAAAENLAKTFLGYRSYRTGLYLLFLLLHMQHYRQWETETAFCKYLSHLNYSATVLFIKNICLFIAAKIKEVWWKNKAS